MTGPLRWEARFESGDRAIDFDHQVLFAIVNEVYSTTLAGGTPLTPLEMLAGFARYAKRHFATEGAFMRATGESDAENHRRAHEGLCADIAVLAKRAGDLEYLDVCAFAYDWLVHHIVEMDLPMVERARSGATISV